jgi:threonine dehydratase
VVGGERYAEALAASEAWAAKTGALPVHAFDQRETLLGQGTLGLELEAQAPDLDTVLVAVGGGGLIGGIAAWYRGRVRVVGVEPALAPTLSEALKAGRPVDAPAGGIAADSLAPRRGRGTDVSARTRLRRSRRPGRRRGYHQCTADDVERPSGRREPGGAAAMSALLSGAYQPARDERVGSRRQRGGIRRGTVRVSTQAPRSAGL